ERGSALVDRAAACCHYGGLPRARTKAGPAVAVPPAVSAGGCCGGQKNQFIQTVGGSPAFIFPVSAGGCANEKGRPGRPGRPYRAASAGMSGEVLLSQYRAGRLIFMKSLAPADRVIAAGGAWRLRGS